MKESQIVLKEVLAKGLVPARNHRDNPMMVTMTGAHIYEGCLESVENFTPLTLPTPNTAFAFPFPQLFILSDVTLLCNVDQIWEYSGSSWTSKISGLTVGTTWTVVDRKNYIILSNMQVTVVKNALTGVYAIDSTLPYGNYGNYNGQLCCGSPNTPASGNI